MGISFKWQRYSISLKDYKKEMEIVNPDEMAKEKNKFLYA